MKKDESKDDCSCSLPPDRRKKKQHAGHSLLRLIESHKYYKQLTRSQHISSITNMAPQMEKNRMYAM
jgi:hypothetical protein